MRTFETGNWGDEVCPICKTNKLGEVILVPIAGTKEGNIAQAKQVHTKCLEDKLFYQSGVEYDFIGIIIQN